MAYKSVFFVAVISTLRVLSWITLTVAPLLAGDLGSQLVEGLSEGKATVWIFAQFEEDLRDDNRYPLELLIEQEISLDFSSKLNFTAAAEYRADNRHFTSGAIDDWTEQDSRRFHINLREAYFKLTAGKADLFVGKKVYAWGKADAFNPTDNINPSDYLDFLISEKIGVLSAELSISGTNAGLDLVYIPLFTPSRIPAQNNRWAINPEPFLPPMVAYVFGKPTFPEEEWENGQAAVRFWATLGSLDIALSAYRGYDSIPAILVGEDPETLYLTLDPVYNEIKEYGLSLARPFGETLLYMEASYRETEADYDDDFLAFAVGLNRSFYVGSAIEEIRLTLEYIDEAFITEKENANRVTSDLARPFRDSVLGEINFVFNEDMGLKIRYAYNLEENDYLFQPQFDYSFSDAFKMEAGLDLIEGDPETFWGNWDSNSRFFSKLKFFF